MRWQFIAAVSLWLVWGMVVDSLTVHCSSFFVAGMRYGGWCSYSSLQQFLCGWYEVWWLMLLQFIAAVSLWLAWGIVFYALTVHCSHFVVAGMRYCVLCSYSSLQLFLCGWHEVRWLMLLQLIAAVSLWLIGSIVFYALTVHCSHFFVAGMSYGGWCSYSSLQQFLCGWLEVWWLMLLQFIAAVSLWLAWGYVLLFILFVDAIYLWLACLCSCVFYFNNSRFYGMPQRPSHMLNVKC